MAEMLERQPPEVQRLLLRTSLLDRVNGELADLLTGATGSERILLDLEDANAFVVSLDPGRTWFRYHRMFSGLLRLELRRTMPTDIPDCTSSPRAGSRSTARPRTPSPSAGGRRLDRGGPHAHRPALSLTLDGKRAPWWRCCAPSRPDRRGLP